MLDRYSRYGDTRTYDESQDDAAFRGTRPRDIPLTPGVLEHRLTRDDRLDRLAAHYYNDVTKWWLILDANPEIAFGGDLDVGAYAGEIIVIPADLTGRTY